MPIELQVKKLKPNATLPKYQSDGAAAFDLHACIGWDETVKVYPGQRTLVLCGFAVAIPDGFYMRIAPRSGLAVKQGIDTLAGVIDSDYRGEVAVALINLGQEPFQIKHGDRIAQGIITKIEQAAIVEKTELTDTVRGAGGYGSTGTN